jgi:hypothetical protein
MVATVRTDLTKWALKQSKQLQAGMPAVAVLICLELDQQMTAAVDTFIDQLHKQLKVSMWWACIPLSLRMERGN